MSRATHFTVAEPNRKPSHYRHKETGASWWRMSENSGLWYRMFRDGSCGPACVSQIKGAGERDPETYPKDFNPCYGDLVITIQDFPR